MWIRLACTFLLAGAGAAHALPLVDQALTRDDVKAQKVRIEEQYDQAQTRCRRVQGHARELCNERARGERDIQQAELQLQAEPTGDNDQKLRTARAEAAYSLALVRCKDFDGQARGVCRDDAKSVFNEAKAEAKLQREVSEQELRSAVTVRDRTAQQERVAETEFNAARERCEVLPGEGRANCLLDAKKRFGRL
ncbi:hypothetical protein [Ramlibacter sp.]|jgi:hypothetical protein|uniref:hypothetical protein n=1 Tax=Ramlibacter sp. TaxID=1917967 RepID=UPI00261E6BD7|nr:hypothetical protein [Ramlibacter sp.]MDB5955780.1 hypothetical protein [Ramlibacter sp.]